MGLPAVPEAFDRLAEWHVELIRRRDHYRRARVQLDVQVLSGVAGPDDSRYLLLAWAEFELWIEEHQREPREYASVGDPQC